MAELPAPVREPKQARSREAWERVIEIGRRLIEEGGVGALTISEVCRRSGVNPPSLYARVDGKAGLFAAVYERGMIDVAATEDELFDGLPRAGASLADQAAGAARAMAGVFAAHERFLRPVITQAQTDPQLLQRGAQESRRLLARFVAAIEVDRATAFDIARTAYAECVMRTLYGADFFSGQAESEAAFGDRLARSAVCRAVAGPMPA